MVFTVLGVYHQHNKTRDKISMVMSLDFLPLFDATDTQINGRIEDIVSCPDTFRVKAKPKGNVMLIIQISN